MKYMGFLSISHSLAGGMSRWMTHTCIYHETLGKCIWMLLNGSKYIMTGCWKDKNKCGNKEYINKILILSV